jgi:HSP20 family protein
MTERKIVSRKPSAMQDRSVESDPFLAMQRRMNRLFDDFMAPLPGLLPYEDMGASFTPRVDVEEDEKEVRVTAELPGMDAKDIDISIHRDVLTLRGEKSSEREEKKGQYHRIERSYGSFERQIPLGVEVVGEKAAAEYRNGVLTITLPKPAGEAATTRRIEVKGA